MLRAIVFDFDGVIADTEPLHLRAFREVLIDEGVNLRAEDYYARYVGLDDWGLVRTLAADWPHLPADRLPAIVARKWQRYEEFISTSSVLVEGAVALLSEWSRHVPLAVASGARAGEIQAILGQAGLVSCFSTIVTAEDVTQGKPAPDIYLLALDRLNETGGRRKARGGEARIAIHPRHVVAIEDSRWGLQSARAAGMRTVGVATNCTADSLAACADLVVSRLTALDLATLERLVRERERNLP